MKNIAEKFKAIGKIAKQTNNSSSIFGSANNLAQSIEAKITFRIAFYPIINDENPEIAMGISSCLCYLLEQYVDVEVYRVFAKIEKSDSEEIDIKDSQFLIDDWEFDGLGDNVLISGNIEQDNSNFTLHFIIDNSLLEEPKDIELDYQFSELYLLINELPQIAEEIVHSIKDKNNSELIISYEEQNSSTEFLNDLIVGVFYWNLDLYLHLWDVEWEDEEIESQFNEMLNLCEKLNHPFGIWCVSMMAKQVMQVGLDAVGDVVVPLIDSIFAQDKDGITSIVVLSKGLLNLGYVEEAISLIEKYTSKESTSALVWIALTETYMHGNQFNKALDTNQRAIEIGIEDERLFWGYTQLLIMAENNDWFVEQLLLVDPDEIDEEDQIKQEIIISLENILEINPNNLIALYTLLPYLIDTESDHIWKYFKQLVLLDKSSHYTRNIIDHLYELDDLKPGFDILNNQAQDNSENPTSYLNLAQLAIIDENTILAQEYLALCEKLIPHYSEDIEIEVQRLKLSVVYLNFDQEYSEIKMILDAKHTVSEHDVEFLEDAIEIAPKFGDLYVTLARCYLSWRDTDTALEVLNDAQAKIGDHPRIIQTLARVLWDKGEKDLSFARLNEGLKHYPNDIPLLTQIAGYLIENNQLSDSKPFIERAEIIAPSHPGLWKLRKQIAEKTTP
jgi:hypothetical protein